MVATVYADHLVAVQRSITSQLYIRSRGFRKLPSPSDALTAAHFLLSPVLSSFTGGSASDLHSPINRSNGGCAKFV